MVESKRAIKVTRNVWPSAASRWLLALAIAGSVLAIGSVHTLSLCVATGVIAVAAAATAWRAEPLRLRPSATILIVIATILTVYTWGQCVPLPARWVALIAPRNADVWSRALSPLGEPGPAWITLSLDPVATRIEGLRGISYLLLFLLAARSTRHKDGVRFLSTVIVATSVILAAAALLHPAFGAKRLFGLYEPGPGVSERHIAPLMNPNQLAAYLNIGLCLSVAATLSPNARFRPVMLSIAAVLAAVQVWIASRGGVACMVLGVVLVLALVQAARARRASYRVLISLGIGLAIVAGMLMIALSSQEARNELMDADVSKIDIMRQAARMVYAYPIFGAGRGSFASTFPMFRGDLMPGETSGFITFSNPENIVLQWATEWGLPLTVCAMGGIALALRPTTALARSTTAAGAWAAIVATAIQNLGDFSSEIPGVVFALVTCAAIVTGGTAGETPHARVARWAAGPRALRSASAVAMGLTLVVAWTCLGKDLVGESRAMYDKAVRRPVPVADLQAFARIAMLRHPAEPYIPYIVGLRMAQLRATGAIAWLGATLERAPMYGPAHLVLARVIGTRSPAQARLEYRLAMEQAPELINTVLNDAIPAVDGYWSARELVPRGRNSDNVLETIVVAIGDRLPATQARLDADLAAHSPTAPGPPARRAQALLLDLKEGDLAPWCVERPTQCRQSVLEDASRVRDLLPERCIGYALRAEGLVLTGAPQQGLAELERAAEVVRDRPECLTRLVVIAEEAHDLVRADAALDALMHAGCGDDVGCTNILVFTAQQQQARGRPSRAVALYEQAYARNPDNEEFLRQAARLAANAGEHARALQDFETLARRHPEDHRWADAAAAERQAMMRGLITP
jgi:O-antigen ligase/tetratricopeptide (TPR) repeat protein